MTKLLKKLFRGIWWVLCSSRRREQITWDMTQEEKALLRAEFVRAFDEKYSQYKGLFSGLQLIDTGTTDKPRRKSCQDSQPTT